MVFFLTGQVALGLGAYFGELSGWLLSGRGSLNYMLARLRSVLGSPLGRNIFYLYLAQGANYLFPLLLLPYLSRILKPEGFGVFAAGQAFGVALIYLLEYGFSLVATREVARHRDDAYTLGAIFGGVFGVRLVLFFPALILAFVAYLVLPVFRGYPEVLLSAVFYFWSASLSPGWFYRGLEKMRDAALLDLVARFLAFWWILLLVKGPEHSYLPLVLNGLATLASSLFGSAMLYFKLPSLTFSWDNTWRFLLLGVRLLPFATVQAAYTTANPIILGLFVSPRELGVFSGAERLVRPLSGLLEPLSRAFFPRLVHVALLSEKEAHRFFLKVLFAMGTFSFGTVLLLELTAPYLVHLFLGPAYAESIPLLRIMAPALFIGSISHALGALWGLAWGMEGLLNRVSLFTVFLQLVLTTFLGATHGVLGAAWGVVLVSLLECAALIIGLLKRGKFPLGGY